MNKEQEHNAFMYAWNYGRNMPRPSLSPLQREVNRLLGIDEATFLRFAEPEPFSSLSPLQREVNRLLGIDEATFLRFAESAGS